MNKIWQWWLSINWKTRSISLTILVISVIMSTTTFVVLIYIQHELIETNLCFFRDFSSLLAYSIESLISSQSKIEALSFIEKIYLNNSSVDYLRLFDSEGLQLFSFPMDNSFFQYLNNLSFNITGIKRLTTFSKISLLSLSIDFTHGMTHCLVPLIADNEVMGFLQLGLNFNNGTIYLTKLFQGISILTFASVWLIFILGIAFNFFIIMNPITELLIGIRNILSGNFSYRIHSQVRGELGHLILSFNNMSERLQFYERTNILQLNVEKAKLESLVATIADGAILLDSELRIILVNRIAVKVFHWVNKDLIGNLIFSYLPVHVNEALLPILNTMVKSTCLDNKNVPLQELRINLNVESLKMFRFLLSTIPNYNRQSFNGIVIIIQDLTKENLLNEAKNQFISNVSHELRTPLFNIKSFIETLHEYGEDLSQTQRQEFLETANHETDRLTRLVNDVLDLSRLESCHIYHLDAVDIAQPIEQTLRTYQLNAKDKGIELNHEIESNLPPVVGHYDLLLQVFANLVGNAMKFTEPGGKIMIRAYILESESEVKNIEAEQIEQGGWIFSPPPPRPIELHLQPQNHENKFVRIEISDTGSGIAPEDQEAIFERFFRVENRVHTLEGTGLGLSIVRNIIDKHHTKVHLVSEVGVGTTFWFDLAVFEKQSVIGGNDLVEITQH